MCSHFSKKGKLLLLTVKNDVYKPGNMTSLFGCLTSAFLQNFGFLVMGVESDEG